MGTRITGRGHHAPERRVDNDEIETRLGLEPGWIERRVGVRARHYASPDEALTDIARPAARMALDERGAPTSASCCSRPARPIICCRPPRCCSRISSA